MSAAPVRLLIHGASGRMGRALLRLASADARFRIVAAVSRAGACLPEQAADTPSFQPADLARVPDFDVAIDFSLPDAVAPLARLCADRGGALVSGTTGLGEAERRLLQATAVTAPVLWASNFSLGIVVLEDLARRASLALARWDASIVETHHVHKKDAPSGTALTLAAAVSSVREGETPIESLRCGEVVGDHLITFASPGETIELRHRAANRDIFALGALEAAALMAGRAPGQYDLAALVLQAD